MSLVIGEKKKKKLTIRGVEYEVSAPSLKSQIVYEEALNSAAKNSDVSATKIVAEYLVAMGLPAEVVGELDSDECLQISKYVMETKKN